MINSSIDVSIIINHNFVFSVKLKHSSSIFFKNKNRCIYNIRIYVWFFLQTITFVPYKSIDFFTKWVDYPKSTWIISCKFNLIFVKSSLCSWLLMECIIYNYLSCFFDMLYRIFVYFLLFFFLCTKYRL